MGSDPRGVETAGGTSENCSREAGRGMCIKDRPKKKAIMAGKAGEKKAQASMTKSVLGTATQGRIRF